MYSSTYTYIPSSSPHTHLPIPHPRSSQSAGLSSQQLPTSHLFYTWSCLYANPYLPICSFSSSPAVSISPFSTSLFVSLPCEEVHFSRRNQIFQQPNEEECSSAICYTDLLYLSLDMSGQWLFSQGLSLEKPKIEK